jgi:tetratricopeptide (TPR) repeat protein
MVRDRRIKRRIRYLFSLSLLVLSTTCAYAKEPLTNAPSNESGQLGVMAFVGVVIGFVVLGAVLIFLDADRRKRLEQIFQDDMAALRADLTKQLEQAQKGDSTALIETRSDIEQLKTAWIAEVEKRMDEKANEILGNINQIDSTLSRQVQEITGSVTKTVKQMTESVTKQSQDATVSISKEVAENSEGKFQNLRTEYKSALKAMAKVVDQQMTTLQKAIADSHKEMIELFCASKFVELLDDDSFRVDASIELIRKHANEDKIIELAQKFPSTSAIHVLRLLSGRQLSPELADRLIKASLNMVDGLVSAEKFEDAAKVSVQIVDAGRQLGLPATTLLPIVRRVAEICKTTRNVTIAEHLHEQFVKLSSDGTGAVTPADVEEMLEMYKLVYPVEKAADMHRRIHHCMQAFGRELDTGALNNLAELASVLTSQGKFEEAHVVLMDIATGLSKTESSLDDVLPAALRTAVKQFITNGRLEQAADINWQLFEAHKSKNAFAAAKVVLAELHSIGKLYLTQTNHDAAAQIEKRRRQGLIEIGASKDEQIEALNDLIEIYLKAEKWESLAKLMQDMITTYKDVYGDHSAETIERVAFAADVLSKVKQYELATTMVETGLIAAAKLWGDYGDKTIGMLNMLADLYMKQARYTDAEVLYRRVLEHQEKSTDARISKTYTHLADTLSLQKDYEAAELYFKKAIDAQESNSGSDHPDILVPLSHLAALYMTAGRYKDAEPCYKRVLEIKYKAHGEHSDEIISSLIELGELYNIQNNFAESEVFLETALETAQRIYSHDDERLADVMILYAKVLSQVGKDDEGGSMHARAQKIKAGELHKVDVQEVLS